MSDAGALAQDERTGTAEDSVVSSGGRSRHREGEICGGIAAFRCAEGLYCSYGAASACGATDRAGTCAKKPRLCPKLLSPVCGCDGRTYGNRCDAAAAGVSVLRSGACEPPISHVGESCGGFTRGPAPVCAEGLYCSYRIEDVCGRADASGTCAEKPDVCSEQSAPVCGCNGETYDNSCAAARDGVAVLHKGACGLDGVGLP